MLQVSEYGLATREGGYDCKLVALLETDLRLFTKEFFVKTEDKGTTKLDQWWERVVESGQQVLIRETERKRGCSGGMSNKLSCFSKELQFDFYCH
jgi:hypothetical protein